MDIEKILKNLSKENMLTLVDQYLGKEDLVSLFKTGKLNGASNLKEKFKKQFSKHNISLKEKNKNGDQLNNQFVKELEDLQEHDKKLKEVITLFFKEIESHQEQLSGSKKVAGQFVREIEKSQEKMIVSSNIKTEFVKEIEISQDKLHKLDNITKEFINELEITQDQLHKTFEVINNLEGHFLKLNYHFAILFAIDNLPEIDECRGVIEENIENIMLELQNINKKVCLL